MKERKLRLIVMCTVFAIWTLLRAACGNGNTAQTADNVERVQQTGRILHIDIDAGQITIETMTASTAGTEGQPPEKPEGEHGDAAAAGKAGGERGDAEQPPEAPENGKAPNAGNGTVYTVTSQTGILDADENSAALSALQEFSVVTFTADGDTLLAVAITADMQNGMAGPGAWKNERIGRHRFRPDGICRGEPLYRGCLGDVRDADVGRNRRVHRLCVEWRSGHIARYYG